MNPILASTSPDSGAAALGGFIFLIVAVAGYFLPTIVAGVNKHHNQTAIAVVNLFLGWTLIGWVAALAWACTKSPSQQVNRPTGTPANFAGADASPEDVVDKLERLGKLKEQGVLTETEFQAQKLELFNKGTPSVSTRVALQPTLPATGRTTAHRLANFSVESPEPKDSSGRLSGLAGALQNQEVQDVAPVPATGLRVLKLAIIVLVLVTLLAIWIVVSLFSKPQPKALGKAVSVSTPASTPHLTDEEIRKQNEIALAALQPKTSPSARSSGTARLTPVAIQATEPSMSGLKSLLDKPLDSWTKEYGSGIAVQDGIWKWIFGRMEVQAFFVGKDKLASFVTVTVPYGRPQLTLAEAKQIAASLGLKNAKQNPADGLRVEWGKEGDKVSADYDGNEGEHSLQITTSLFKLGPGP